MKKLFLSILILMLAGMLAAQTYNHCMVYDYYDQDVKRQSYVEFEKGRIDTTYLRLKPIGADGKYKALTAIEYLNLLSRCGFELVTSTTLEGSAVYVLRKKEEEK